MPRYILNSAFSSHGSDTIRDLERKLNTMFSEIYAASPSLTERTELKMTVASSDGEVDPPHVTRSKLGRMIGEIAAAVGFEVPRYPYFTGETVDVTEDRVLRFINRLTDRVYNPPPPPYVPAMKFNDARNSMYL